MATDGLEFNDIYLLVRGALNDGRLKLHKGGVIFKANKTGKIDQAAVADIESTSWLRVARGFELNVALTNGVQFKFEGFKEADYDQLASFIKENFERDLEEIELSVKGWNWGTAKFQGSSLCFEVDDKPAFIVPLKDVSQATTGKNEVTLEFHQNDDAQICMMEMRFYIPTPADNPTEDPVKNFHQKVLEKADIIQATGDAIVTIPDVACLTPRGRYTMKVFPSFLQLHGKTYDYKIPYTSVLRLFLLPHKDQRFMFFVVSMDPPIKQGQTRYPFLIIQFGKDDEIDVKLNLSEEELKEKYEGKITQEMEGPIYEIVSRLMKAVVGRRITVPGTFRGHAGISCITCSYRAGSGMLYPLERGFIFVHKPPVHIRFDEISSVNFARVAGGGGSSRSFDFEVETKSGSYVFSSIEKEEYGKLFDFVSGKHLRIKNTGKVSSKQYEDELMPGSDEDSHDAYLEQMKAEGAEKYEESESSEDESDESFNPGSGGEDQDLKEEFESDPSSSESEGESGEESKPKHKEKEKKKKKSPEKKRKAEKTKSPAPKKKAKISADEPQGKRKKKAKKDADAPKRPMSAYMLWLNEIREQIKQENPGISVTELSKVAGEKWKKIDDKTKWQEMAKEAKKKYDEAMKVYKEKKANEPDDSPDEKPSKKGSVKEFFSKKGDKKKTASPRKAGGGESQKFKSAEFVETDDSSSEEEEKKSKPKPKAKPKAKSKPEKSRSKSKKESEEEESEEEEEESEDVDISEDSDSD